MRSRVMPGSLVTMARRVPVKRLKSVDLPTLGRPTITSDGRSSGIGLCAGRPMGAVARNAIFQCSAFPFTRVEGVQPLGYNPGILYRCQRKGLTKLHFINV